MNKIRQKRLDKYINELLNPLICEWCEDNSEDSIIMEREIKDDNQITKTILCSDCYYIHDQQMAYGAAS